MHSTASEIEAAFLENGLDVKACMVLSQQASIIETRSAAQHSTTMPSESSSTTDSTPTAVPPAVPPLQYLEDAVHLGVVADHHAVLNVSLGGGHLQRDAQQAQRSAAGSMSQHACTPPKRPAEPSCHLGAVRHASRRCLNQEIQPSAFNAPVPAQADLELDERDAGVLHAVGPPRRVRRALVQHQPVHRLAVVNRAAHLAHDLQEFVRGRAWGAGRSLVGCLDFQPQRGLRPIAEGWEPQ